MKRFAGLVKRFAFVAVALLALPAMAQLTATVTPGYSFAEGERPTVDTLNLLGQPTIEISGTVSGTVGLGAGTVTGVHLADSVPDNVTLNYNASSPRQIRIKAAGVGVTQISSTIAGPGLTGGSGVALSVLPDNTTVTTNGSSQVIVKTDGIRPNEIKYNTTTTSGTTLAIDWSTALTFIHTLTGSTTVTFSNAKDGQSITVALKQDGTGSRTVSSWPTIVWRGGVAPTLTTTAAHTDIITFVKIGSNIYGSYALNFF